MEGDSTTAVWVEGQIDEEGISLTLVSEGQDGAVVEEIKHFTFDELQDMSGEMFSLNLSDETRDGLREQLRLSNIGRVFEEDSQESEEGDGSLPERGDVLTDENSPHWSDDDGVEVTEVLQSTRADRYVVQGPNEGRSISPKNQQFTDQSVANANPSYPDDDCVILGRYIGGSKEYAFPESRLE